MKKRDREKMEGEVLISAFLPSKIEVWIVSKKHQPIFLMLKKIQFGKLLFFLMLKNKLLSILLINLKLAIFFLL